MKIVICKNYDEMSAYGAKMIADQLNAKPDSVLGLATGSTPEGMYASLIDMCRKNTVSFAQASSVNLDEYYPLAPTNDQSYRYFMNTKLFDHVNIDKTRTNVPNGLAEDPEAEGRRYDALIDELGGIDIQVLGIGRNGHIAFNEPAAKLDPKTHVTDLTENTIKANARFFESEADVPTRALTMGIGSILKAKKIIILASGTEKKDAVMSMVSGMLDTYCPASLLNLHPDVTLICTEDAIDANA